MIRYREITDGTTTISLISKGGNSRLIANSGLNIISGNAQIRDTNISQTIDGTALIAENYSLNMKGVSTAELAVKCQQLIKLLRKSQNYKKTFWQRTPVYIKEKLSNETNTRYALCFGTAGLNYSDLFENVTEFQNVITNIGIVLVREHPWRSDVPGVLPTIKTLTASDGPANPTKVVVANFDENNIGITHIYNSSATFTLPVYDTEGHASNANGNNTVNINVGAHSNKALFILVFAVGAAAPAITMTVAGVPATLVQNFGTGVIANSTLQLWQFIAPAAGANAVVATIALNTGNAMSVLSYYNVDQTVPLQTPTYSNFTASPFSNTVLGGFSTLTIDGLMNYGAALPVITPDASQTSRENFQMAALNYKMGMSEKAGDSSVTMLWTSTNVTGAIKFAACINPVVVFGAYSANLVATPGITVWSIGGAMPVVDNVIYFGSTAGPLKHICIPIAVPGQYTCDILAQYLRGGGTPNYITLAAGSQFTLLPTGNEDSIFKTVNEWVINVKCPSDHAVATINGVSAWWIAVRINTLTAFLAWPVTGTVCYEQHDNYLEIPSTEFVGDSNPLTLLRLFNPHGGTTSPVMGTPSRMIIGARSIMGSNFHSNLNLGGAGQPAGWALANGTDATSVADVQATGGARGNVSYATSTSMVARFTLTGTAKLQYWLGRFRVFLRAQQIGGANGDCRVKLRTMIGGSTSGYPLKDSEIVPLATHDVGWEVVDLTSNSFLQIPFSDITDADLTGIDLIFIIQADRSAGTSTLQVADLILIPIDEWAMELRDPISDTTTGASALRGDTLLDADSGLLGHRILKQIIISSVAYPAETWN